MIQRHVCCWHLADMSVECAPEGGQFETRELTG